MTVVKNPRDALRALFALRDRLSAAPSVQGALEDQLRQGTRVQCAVDLDRAQRKHHALAEAALQAATLTPEEEEICQMRYAPDARETGTEIYERVVRDCDAPTATSGEGEDILGQAKDPAGAPILGHARVKGRRARMPSFAEIAEAVQLTPRQVESRLGSALRKVRQAIARSVAEFGRLDEMDP